MATENPNQPIHDRFVLDMQAAAANRRFEWWMKCFLAALADLSGTEASAADIAEDAGRIANHAAPYIANAYKHFVIEGKVEPES